MSAKVDKRKLFNDLIKSYSSTYPQKAQKDVQEQVASQWKAAKAENEGDEVNFVRAIDAKIAKLKETTNRRKLSSMNFFKNAVNKGTFLSLYF